MTPSRTLVPIVLAALAALAGCGDPGAGAGDADAPDSDTASVAASDTAAAPADAGSPSIPSTAGPSGPDAGADLRAAVCDTLASSFDCARAVERRRIGGEDRVWRHGDTLRVSLASGDTARFVDQPGGHARSEHYSYQDAWPDVGLIVLQKQYYEGAEFILVDDSTGERTRIPDWPVLSPDGRYFAVLSLDLVAGYGPNTLQIWTLEEGRPERVWETEPSQWGPRSGRWQDGETLRFIQHGYCGELGGEGRRMCERPATLTRRGGAWHLDTGTVRDAP